MGDEDSWDLGDELELLDGLSDGAVQSIELFDSILQDAVDAGASTLSFVPHPKPTVSFRVRGSRTTPETHQAGVGENYQGMVTHIKVLAGLNIVEREKSQSGFFERSINNQSWVVIVDLMPTESGECLTLKLEPPRSKPLLFEDLGVADETLDAMRAIINAGGGTLIVAGKSRDVAHGIEALCNLDVLATSSVACLSYSGRIGSGDATRVAVGSEARVAPDAALRETRRQDFRAIVLSEVFDMATAHQLFDGTAQSAFHAAGLITAGACAVPPRLLDLGTPLFNLQEQLAGMLGFRLANRLCYACREQREPKRCRTARSGVRRSPHDRGLRCSRMRCLRPIGY